MTGVQTCALRSAYLMNTVERIHIGTFASFFLDNVVSWIVSPLRLPHHVSSNLPLLRYLTCIPTFLDRLDLLAASLSFSSPTLIPHFSNNPKSKSFSKFLTSTLSKYSPSFDAQITKDTPKVFLRHVFHNKLEHDISHLLPTFRPIGFDGPLGLTLALSLSLPPPDLRSLLLWQLSPTTDTTRALTSDEITLLGLLNTRESSKCIDFYNLVFRAA